ncbi:MAG: hypothetical protein WA628_27105 [Terriglobales bacterium]
MEAKSTKESKSADAGVTTRKVPSGCWRAGDGADSSSPPLPQFPDAVGFAQCRDHPTYSDHEQQRHRTRDVHFDRIHGKPPAKQEAEKEGGICALLSFLLGGIDLESAAAQAAPGERGARFISFGRIRHLDESETARASRLLISHDTYTLYHSVSLKQCS